MTRYTHKRPRSRPLDDDDDEDDDAHNSPERIQGEICRRHGPKLKRYFGEKFPGFTPSISRANQRKKFHKSSITHSRRHGTKFLHC